jgi:hypothetical protein
MARGAPLLLLLLAAASVATSELADLGPVLVSVGETAQRDASAVLSHVLPELQSLLRSYSPLDPAPRSDGEGASAVHFDLAPDWRRDHLTPAAERSTRIVVSAAPPRVVVEAWGLLGLAYAVHDLREHLALLPSPSPSAWADAVLAFGRRAAPSPAYTTRAWSEEGQLLAIPDRGYYTADGAAANMSAIASEAAALEAEIVPALLRLKMNTLIVLNSDVEDYVSYDQLPQFMPNAPVIYASNDTHRVRAAGIVSVMNPWIAHLRDAFGIAFMFQVYELSSPPGVCLPSPGGKPALLNCSLGSSDTAALLQARYSELRASLPALAGVVVTVEDSWAPRAGYEFTVMWTTQPQLPEVVTLFHDAINGTAGLRMIFRLWLFGQTVDWTTLRDGSPPGAEFSVKQTQGDFLLDYPINQLLECSGGDCPPRDRRMIVEVDAFRQYNGWTAAVCWMGSQWAPRLAEAHANGATDVWGWGSWAPGCTWPDSGSSLENATAGEYKSWRSWWNSYRIFNGTDTNGGFSLGGQANAYLLSRLSWDAPVDTNATEIALDFGNLFYGASNAAAVAALLEASLGAWIATSSPNIGDFSLFWTMMQHDPVPSKFAALAKAGWTVAEFEAAANASAAAVAQMEAALAQIDPAAVPPTNPAGYAGAARAVSVTKLYLSAYFAWRSAGLAVAILGLQKSPPQANCTAARGRVAASSAAASAFGAAFPVEGSTWVVSSLDPALYSAPSFLTNTAERFMLAYESRWTGEIDAACAGA